MRAKATLQLDDGEALRVELDRDDLAREEIVVRRAHDQGAAPVGDLADVLRRHLEDARSHPAGTTDRLLTDDRERPY